MKYDPQQNIDSRVWLSLAENERVRAVDEYHRSRKIKLPNSVLHSLFHVIVENQVALGDDFIAEATLQRLIGEGLYRHEAIHAIASVLAGHVYKAVKTTDPMGDAAAVYKEKLTALNADEWKKQMPEPATS